MTDQKLPRELESYPLISDRRSDLEELLGKRGACGGY